ncbi:MAG: DUF3592 domain-containing protein [Pseudomonadota bacterium]
MPSEHRTPPPFRRSLPLFLQVIVVAFCSVFLLLGLGILNEAAMFVRWGTPAVGEVVSIRTEVETRSDDDGMTRTYETDWPTVRYDTATGDTFENEVEIAIGYGDQSVGTQVRVRYLEANPNRVILARSFWDLWLAPIGFIVIGTLFTGGSFAFFWYSNRAERRAYRKKWGIEP